MTKSTLKKTLSSVAVWVAIIGCISAVLVALITAVPPFIDEFRETPISPSETPIQSQNPLFTPTFLPTIDPTKDMSCVFSNSCFPGDDWKESCINKDAWTPFLEDSPTPISGICYDLGAWGIKAENENLIFATQRTSSTAYEYGLMAPWQNWSEVNVSINVKDLEFQYNEIWVGVFEGNTTASNGIVFVIQPDDVVDVRREPNKTDELSNLGLHADGKFNLQFIFSGGKVTIWANNQKMTSDTPLGFTPKNIFIGYRIGNITNIDATIFDLKFTP